MANKYEHLRPNKTEQNELEIIRQSRISAAERTREIPTLDFHGMQAQDVPFEIDRLLRDHADADAVKIVTGHGKGIIKKAVAEYLKELSRQPNPPFEMYYFSTKLPEYIVLMKRG